PEWAVEGTPVRHRIQVAAGHDRASAVPRWPRTPGGGSREIPPGPQVAVAVAVRAEAAFRRGRGEPGPALLVLRRPAEPAVATRRVVPPDRQQRVPQLREAHGRVRFAVSRCVRPAMCGQGSAITSRRAWGRGRRAPPPPPRPPRIRRPRA